MSKNSITIQEALNEAQKWSRTMKAFEKIQETIDAAAQAQRVEAEAQASLTAIKAELDSAKKEMHRVHNAIAESKAESARIAAAAADHGAAGIEAASKEAGKIREAAHAEAKRVREEAQAAADTATAARDRAEADRAAAVAATKAEQAKLDEIRAAIAKITGA